MFYNNYCVTKCKTIFKTIKTLRTTNYNDKHHPVYIYIPVVYSFLRCLTRPRHRRVYYIIIPVGLVYVHTVSCRRLICQETPKRHRRKTNSSCPEIVCGIIILLCVLRLVILCRVFLLFFFIFIIFFFHPVDYSSVYFLNYAHLLLPDIPQRRTRRWRARIVSFFAEKYESCHRRGTRKNDVLFLVFLSFSLWWTLSINGSRERERKKKE